MFAHGIRKRPRQSKPNILHWRLETWLGDLPNTITSEESKSPNQGQEKNKPGHQPQTGRGERRGQDRMIGSSFRKEEGKKQGGRRSTGKEVKEREESSQIERRKGSEEERVSGSGLKVQRREQRKPRGQARAWIPW